MFGLDPDTIRNIKTAFSELPQIEKVILYGSRAKGNYKKGSDIDITLLGKNLNLQTIYQLDDKLDELYLPYTFDISIFNQIDNLDLIDHIKRVGKVFYIKKSGLPQGWEVKKLNNISENLDSQRVPITKRNRKAGEIPYYGASGIVDYVADFIFDEDLLCISEDGANLLARTYPIAFSISGKTWVNNHAHILRFKEMTTQKFVELYLNSIRLDDFISGMAQPKLNQTMLNKIPILFPPLKEQKRIVAILGKAFTIIDKAKANAEKNLANAKELFESYLNGIFANPGEDWKEKKLGDNNLVEIIDGDRGKNYPTKKDFSEEGFCLFMNTKNVRPDGFEFNTTMYIDEVKDNAMGKGKLKRNDVVMTTRGTIGNLGIYNRAVKYDNIRINSGMLIFRPNQKEIISEYLFELFRSSIVKSQIKRHVSGAAQPQLPIKTLVSFSLPVPKSIKKQHTIVKTLELLSDQTKSLEKIYQQKIDDLEELKKSILQKAFVGEL